MASHRGFHHGLPNIMDLFQLLSCISKLSRTLSLRPDFAFHVTVNFHKLLYINFNGEFIKTKPATSIFFNFLCDLSTKMMTLNFTFYYLFLKIDTLNMLFKNSFPSSTEMLIFLYTCLTPLPTSSPRLAMGALSQND